MRGCGLPGLDRVNAAMRRDPQIQCARRLGILFDGGLHGAPRLSGTHERHINLLRPASGANHAASLAAALFGLSLTTPSETSSRTCDARHARTRLPGDSSRIRQISRQVSASITVEFLAFLKQ